MKGKNAPLLAIVAAIVSSFSIGYVARDIIMADQVVIVNDQGKRAAVLGHDQLGNGLLLLFDADGNEIASIRNGRVQAENRPTHAPTSSGASAPASPPNANQRQFVLQVQSHRTLEPDASLLREIDDLKDEIKGHRSKISSLNRWLAMDYDDDPGDKRARQGWLKEKRDHEKLIREKETEIAQVQRKYDTPVQEIVGVDADGNEVWLTTTRDLSHHLLRINRGDFIQWSGEFKSHTETRRFYTVDNIKPIDRPAWF